LSHAVTSVCSQDGGATASPQCTASLVTVTQSGVKQTKVALFAPNPREQALAVWGSSKQKRQKRSIYNHICLACHRIVVWWPRTWPACSSGMYVEILQQLELTSDTFTWDMSYDCKYLE